MAKGKTVEALRKAFALCGYDLDEVMSNKTRKRAYADLRSVAWSIYQRELHRTFGQVSRAFGWNRSTVNSSLIRASQLRNYDADFNNLYDSIYSHYQLALTNHDKERVTANAVGRPQGAF